MKKTMSIMLAAMLSMGVLVGCGSESSSTPASTSSATPSVSNDTPASNDASASATETATTGKIMMANGEQDLPAEFSNYAILDWGYLDHLTHLNAPPAASPITNEPAADATNQSLVSYLDGYGRTYPDRSILDDIEPINASDSGIDLEQLLSLNLNYIITSEGNIEYADKLNAICPTYFIPSTLTTDANGNKDWKELHRTLAQLVGKVDEAEANIKEYDDMVADYKAQIGDQLEGKTAIVTQISTKGVQSSKSTNHPHVFTQLGLTVPAAFPDDGGTYALENLIEFDPDYLFINVESWDDFATYESSPIWQNLKAVQNGNVFEFAHNVWNRTNGSRAAFMRVTDVCDFILDGTQVTNRYDYLG